MNIRILIAHVLFTTACAGTVAACVDQPAVAFFTGVAILSAVVSWAIVELLTVSARDSPKRYTAEDDVASMTKSTISLLNRVRALEDANAQARRDDQG